MERNAGLGIPYTVEEARVAAESPFINIYHKEIILWLCDEVNKKNASCDADHNETEEG